MRCASGRNSGPTVPWPWGGRSRTGLQYESRQTGLLLARLPALAMVARWWRLRTGIQDGTAVGDSGGLVVDGRQRHQFS